jgi:STIP1 homology and U-box containing protein 1
LYSNRAQCFRKLGQWKECYEDALAAIELQELNIKAHMLCGQALFQMGKFERTIAMVENGIKRMTRAYSLCSSQNKRSYEKDILSYLSRGKKLLFYKQKEIENTEKKELYAMIVNIEENNKSTPETQKRSNLEELKSVLFENEPNKEIPEFMIDGLSKKVMRDPVILPTGVSFERESLEEFFSKNGFIDPVSR